MAKEKTPVFYPTPYDVIEGKIYYWCSCGKTSSEPLCDSNPPCEQAVEFKPILTETVYFCGCKKTQDPPLCDGSHAKVMLDYLNKIKNKKKTKGI